MVVLLTGITGLLGSHTAFALLKAGHRVIALSRGKSGMPAGDRVRRLLLCHPGLSAQGAEMSRLYVIDGDVMLPWCGLPASQIETLAGQFDVAIHCAGNVSYATGTAGAALEVNVSGAVNLAELCKALDCPKLVHVSTAYVDQGLRGGEFRTDYEQSKLKGEQALGEFAASKGIKLAIVRPSIITGDRVYGFTPNYNGVYPFLKYAAVFSNELRHVRPENWFPPDLLAEGKCNLVPADHVAAIIMQAAHERDIEEFINITNPAPWPLTDLLRAIAGCLGCTESELEALGSGKGGALPDSPARAIECLKDEYGPYFSVNPELETGPAERLAENAGLPPLRNTQEWIQALMRWGVSQKWKDLA